MYTVLNTRFCISIFTKQNEWIDEWLFTSLFNILLLQNTIPPELGGND